ncbi:glycosyltransferase family protein [Actinobacillus vicugnae]|uniref:glycosyltransferase family protein n=1 Tax=Actinobacillus vicugnae TaxID=2573093 RepID=UPI001FCB826B|nr:glycosyltransferase [Actinobacillus vicugnae]
MQNLITSHCTSPPPRIAFYSHDTMGFGHIRRNMLLAQSVLQANPNTDVLLLSGVRESGAFKLPKGADTVTLPTYFKTADGEYIPRSLGTDIKRLVKIRRKIIHAALEAFEPDILVVDNVPRGAMNELDSILPELANHGTHLVLGLRDIIDEPDVVRKQWQKLKNIEIIRLYFSSIWVYGDPQLFDFTQEYNLPNDISKKLHYMGYLDQTRRMEYQGGLNTVISDMPSPYALCMVGGGQDGFDLAKNFLQAQLPEGWSGLLISGALMPSGQRRHLELLTEQRPDICMVDFVAEPLKLMQNAECMISMGGYNTTTEILSFNKCALIVPRIRPRLEQWIRASRLAKMGVIDCLHPNDLTPEALSAWLAKQKLQANARDMLKFNGLDNVVSQINQIIKFGSSL